MNNELTIYQKFVDKNIKYGNYNSIDHQTIKKAKNYKMDIVAARNNLLDIKEIMDRHNIKFTLVYGTVLGAIREGNFIVYDTDTDVALLEKDREKFINSIPDILLKGFILFRTTSNDSIVSFFRDTEYIDIYLFNKKGKYYNCGELYIRDKYLDSVSTIEWFGKIFNIPNNIEGFLLDTYGKDWRISRKNEHAIGAKRFNSFWIFKQRLFNSIRESLLKTKFGQILRKTKRKIQGNNS